ncbi:storkhead-box protein 2 [Ornithorhynchus anatinus]|uniref:storkhead-box protein 2 n=1 Tax=Ornithorhynchus anatinus TaxID=9258 RepID=UPI0019D4A2E5|nr:storkhead-box protein 2 [Ornithorhynchus anatinus]
MSPISQSQFIPLGEILCLAISTMNSARKPVTQEALMEHLTTCFPGVPTPSPDILRHTLNMLVRERKVYPTPDGYFVVTPQTHFITPSLIRANSKWYHLDERLPERAGRGPSPQPGPAAPGGPPAGPRDRPLPKTHCDACHCCREELHGPHASTLQRRAAKEPAFFGAGGGIAAPPLGPAPERPKAEAPAKPKDGGGGPAPEKPSKKFGLKLFRLSFKKDKAKQLANFSAQFPPREWPLRDEDAPTAIPREVEVEIIRRINPSLTVENIGRHTALMKKLEEEKAQRSRAGPSAPAGARGKRGRSHRKAHGKARSHSKSRVSRGEPSDGSRPDHRPPPPGERDSDPGDPRGPREGGFEAAGGFPPHGPCALEARFPATPEWDVSGELAKRRTEVPFPEPSRGSFHHHHAKVHRSHSHTQDRRSRHERPSKAKERSRSMDNAQGPLGAADPGASEDGAEAGRRGDPAPGPPPAAALDGALRPAPAPGHARVHGPAAGYPESPGSGGPPEPGAGSAAAAVADDYFQCGAAGEAGLPVAPTPGQEPAEGPAADGAKKPGAPDRPPQRPEGRGGSPVGPPGPGPAPDAFVNGRPEPPASGESGGLDKRKEVFSKDTLFRPPPGPALPLGGYHKPGPDGPLPARGEKPEPAPTPAPRPAEPAGKPEASFDYYNVSDDDEDSEEGGGGGARPPPEEKGRRGAGGGGGGCCGGGGVGTMQWLLEREKERDLQRKFEKNLTLLAPKEADGVGQQRATHSARLDSMDSSSITVDSGFNSPRTRESLASNTSSIVESSRRQNPTSLSPVHAASAPAFPFRASPDAPGQSEADKLQKPTSCLQASVTSV